MEASKINIQKYILAHFHYHSDGTLTRDDRKNSEGSFDKDGYLIIKVKGKRFKAHRIVWLLNYGEMPKKEIDHINRIRTDNRIENLREATREEQIRNTTKKVNKDTGAYGIYYDKTRGLKKHYAFCYKGKTYRYSTLEEAREQKKCIVNL